MKTRVRGIKRKNRGVSGSHKGMVNVESVTGVEVWRLQEETELFGDYYLNGNPWIPEKDWMEMAAEYFPGCDRFSLIEDAADAGYADRRSFKSAITRAGSAFHFNQDGPLWVTASSSLD